MITFRYNMFRMGDTSAASKTKNHISKKASKQKRGWKARLMIIGSLRIHDSYRYDNATKQ